MRKIRGAKELSAYFDSIGCRMSESTIYKLMRIHAIPYRKPVPHVLIFDLDEIDAWLGGGEVKAK